MKEEWRDISDYEGYYQVSNLGRVRSLDRVVPYTGGKPRRLKGRILAKGMVGSGRKKYAVRLTKQGKGKTFYVHSLVAKAFLGICPVGLEVCHGSKGPHVNSIDNIRYDTHLNNTLDRYEEGTMPSKPVRRSDGIEFRSASEAGRITGVDRGDIRKVCGKYINPTNGKRRLTAGGFSWEFI